LPVTAGAGATSRSKHKGEGYQATLVVSNCDMQHLSVLISVKGSLTLLVVWSFGNDFSWYVICRFNVEASNPR